MKINSASNSETFKALSNSKQLLLRGNCDENFVNNVLCRNPNQDIPEFTIAPEVFLCPKDKNHRCVGKERFIRHLWNCKLLKCYPEFFSCKFETYHLFLTSEEKVLHERECPTQAKYKVPGAPIDGSQLIPNFKFENPGYDPNYQRQTEDNSFFIANRERLYREEQEIRNEKSRVRINLSSLTSLSRQLNEAEGIAEDTVSFFASLGDGFVRFLLRVLDKAEFDKHNVDLDRHTIFQLRPNTDSQMDSWVRGFSHLEDSLVGELSLGTVSQSFSQTVCNFKAGMIEQGLVSSLKDKQENIFCVVGLSNLDCRNKMLAKYQTLTMQSIVVLYYKKSTYYQALTDLASQELLLVSQLGRQQEKLESVREANANIHSQIKSLEEHLAVLKKTKASVGEELARIEQKKGSMKNQEFERQRLLTTEAEMALHRRKIKELQDELAAELQAFKQLKTAEHVEQITAELEQIQQKTSRCAKNIVALRSTISQLEENSERIRMQSEDKKRDIASAESAIAELAAQLEKIPVPLERTDLGNKVAPTALLVCTQTICHLCKTKCVEMVTKPCNHCVLCWQCFSVWVHVGLRGCLMCGVRVEHVFRMKFL